MLERTQQVACILAATRHNSLDQLLSQLDVDIELAPGNETLCAGPFGVMRLRSDRDDAAQDKEDFETTTLNPEWDDQIMEALSSDLPLSGLEVGFFDSPNNHDGGCDEVDIHLTPSIVSRCRFFYDTDAVAHTIRSRHATCSHLRSSHATDSTTNVC